MNGGVYGKLVKTRKLGQKPLKHTRPPNRRRTDKLEAMKSSGNARFILCATKHTTARDVGQGENPVPSR